MAGSVVAPPSTAIFFVTDVARPSALQQTNGPLHDALCTSIQTSTTASVVKLRTVAVTVHDQQPTARSAKSPSNAAVAGSVLQGSPTRYLALCLCTFPYQIMDHGTLHGILPRRTYAHHTCFAAFISRCTVYRRGSAPASGPLLLQIASRGPPPDFEAYDTHPGMYKYSGGNSGLGISATKQLVYVRWTRARVPEAYSYAGTASKHVFPCPAQSTGTLKTMPRPFNLSACPSFRETLAAAVASILSILSSSYEAEMRRRAGYLRRRLSVAPRAPTESRGAPSQSHRAGYQGNASLLIDAWARQMSLHAHVHQ
ncbi:uncharacterized protein TRIVIDRAFT_196999 [Trichoderma virens Gv29-8]|uniref:Uncharacterized protein n=1 Tax=Hypocrea virens (strain Gv29-8 / FGSC 10586) TaxID=413071 RepID=G9MFG5_HYPVG|nr:uncharacterized protein TRIVIDRAFT_196999 [Trichoderma virens Gv29-8]EHK27131.1 hypothetical protein TRIVIDRAFT_196999 [Trichoderma virens Gv29-8]